MPAVDEFLIEKTLLISAVGHGTQPEFGTLRGAQFAHEQQIERNPQRLGDLIADRYAAARHGEYDGRRFAVMMQRSGQTTTGRRTVGKDCVRRGGVATSGHTIPRQTACPRQALANAAARKAFSTQPVAPMGRAPPDDAGPGARRPG